MQILSLIFSRDKAFWEGTQRPGALESLILKGDSRILKVFPKKLGTCQVPSDFVPFNWFKRVWHLLLQGSCLPTRPCYCTRSLESQAAVVLLLEKHKKNLVILSNKAFSNQLHVPPWPPWYVSVIYLDSLTGPTF